MDLIPVWRYCRKIKDALKNKGKDCLIAPAYYWGINICTGGFAGSFTVKPETMSSVLKLAKTLKSSMTTAQGLADWQKGGASARNIKQRSLYSHQRLDERHEIGFKRI